MGLYRLDARGTTIPEGTKGKRRKDSRPTRRPDLNRNSWKRRSARQIKRQPWCSHCGHTGSKENPLTADHVVPGQPELDTLCRSCNSRKGDRVA